MAYFVQSEGSSLDYTKLKSNNLLKNRVLKTTPVGIVIVLNRFEGFLFCVSEPPYRNETENLRSINEMEM
jgi:hypothetical protein